LAKVIEMNVDLYLDGLKQKNQVSYIKLLTIVRQEYKIPESLVTTSAIFRFLEAREGNVEDAAQGILEFSQWRQSYDWKGVKELDPEITNNFLSMVKYGYYGEDSKGRPIRYMQIQKCNVGEIFKKAGPENLALFQLSLIERTINIILELCTRKYQRHIYNVVTIVDVENLEVSQILSNTEMLSFAKSKAGELQKFYPELTHKSIIINAGTIFYSLWKVISLFFNKRTTDRIKIFNKDYMDELLQISPIEKIPYSFGGKCLYEIDNYPNFYDGEFYKSIQEKRIGLNN